MESSTEALGLDYWLRWQVPVCALIFVIPAGVSVIFIIHRVDRQPLRSIDFWVPCWRNLSPLWLLSYRAFALVVMAFLLYQTVVTFGPFVFYFYTQFFRLFCLVLSVHSCALGHCTWIEWTFTLVMVYFALATFVSARGCWIYCTKILPRGGEGDKFLKKDVHGSENETTTDSKGIKSRSNNLLQIEQPVGFWENAMQIVYPTCGGAVMLTDIVFWCLLLPFMSGENFRLTLLIGCMHSVNAVFLLLDSILNNLQFPWHRFTYFVLWSCTYVVFQWILHACGFTWWPYPFLELSTPWAPLWYFSIALVHLPCYGLYALLIKAKGSIFPRLFPQMFVRSY